MNHRLLDCKKCSLPFCKKTTDFRALILNQEIAPNLYWKGTEPASVDLDLNVPIELLDLQEHILA